MANKIIRPFEYPDDQFVKMHNALFDFVMPALPPNAWKILCLIVRETFGRRDKEKGSAKTETEGIGYRAIKDRTGISSSSTVQDALEILIKSACILMTESDGFHAASYMVNPKFVISNKEQFQAIVKAIESGGSVPEIGTVKTRRSVPKTGTVSVPKTGTVSVPEIGTASFKDMKDMKDNDTIVSHEAPLSAAFVVQKKSASDNLSQNQKNPAEESLSDAIPKTNGNGKHKPIKEAFPVSEYELFRRELFEHHDKTIGSIANGAKEGAAIKWLFGKYSAADCIECFNALFDQIRDENHWRDGTMSWTLVKTCIGSWLTAKRNPIQGQKKQSQFETKGERNARNIREFINGSDEEENPFLDNYAIEIGARLLES